MATSISACQTSQLPALSNAGGETRLADHLLWRVIRSERRRSAPMTLLLAQKCEHPAPSRVIQKIYYCAKVLLALTYRVFVKLCGAAFAGTEEAAALKLLL